LAISCNKIIVVRTIAALCGRVVLLVSGALLTTPSDQERVVLAIASKLTEIVTAICWAFRADSCDVEIAFVAGARIID